MSVLPLREALDGFDCKRPGCTDRAKRNRGPTAYLCPRHAEERQRELDAQGRPRPGAGGLRKKGRHQARLEKLLEGAKAADHAEAAAARAKERVEPAMRDAQRLKEEAEEAARQHRIALRQAAEEPRG